MLTEQPNPKTTEIDRLPTSDMLQVINQEDQQVALAVQQVLPAIADAVDLLAERLQVGGRLIYIGAGTSGRLGVLDAVECVPTFGTPPDLVRGYIAGGETALTQAVEGAEDDPVAAVNDLAAIDLTAVDTIVGIAASGRTPYVLGAVQFARKTGCKTIGIACNVPSPLLEAVDVAIGVVVGPEVVTGSTRMKAGSAQKMVLNMLSTATMVKLGKVYGNLMVDVQVTNAKLQQRATNLVRQLTGLNGQEAVHVLKQGGNNVKVAVVMHHRQVDADKARDLLNDANGVLRSVIGDVL